VLHFLLFLGCVASIEIFLNLNFINSFKKIISIARKVFLVMVDKGMSDNKKEKVIPVFAFQLMKYSLIILLILLMVISVFLGISFLEPELIPYLFSFTGILESMLFAFIYFKVRSSILQ
jgi:thiosulfate reductase cytochrome b subunit